MSSPSVLITGASRGIGLATARILLASFNAKIVTLSRSRTPELEALANEFKGRVEIVQGDATDATASKKAVQAAVDKFGGLAGLILNHGTLEPLGKLADVDPSAVAEALNINLVSLLHVLQPALPHLRAAHGRVVFVSSGAATGGYGAWGAYSASKAAMNSFNRTLATEEKDIASFAVRPGVVDTDMQKLIREKGGETMSEKEHAKFTGLHAEGKLVKPEQPGHVLAALVVKGDPSLSGQFVSWDAAELAPYRA